MASSSSSKSALRPMPPELPAHIEDWQRKIKQERTLNDMIEDVHRVLVEDPQYRSYLRASWDSQAVEGSLSCDNTMAAIMIRNKAKDMGSDVASEKLATINQSLGVVLRRYGASRKERRNTVGGEIVPSADKEND